MSISSKEVEQQATIIVGVAALDEMQDRIATLKAQRDELLEACKAAEMALIGIAPAPDAWDLCRKAIAAVEREGR
jgi:hypothetical protein